MELSLVNEHLLARSELPDIAPVKVTEIPIYGITPTESTPRLRIIQGTGFKIGDFFVHKEIVYRADELVVDGPNWSISHKNGSRVGGYFDTKKEALHHARILNRYLSGLITDQDSITDFVSMIASKARLSAFESWEG